MPTPLEEPNDGFIALLPTVLRYAEFSLPPFPNNPHRSVIRSQDKLFAIYLNRD
jgi:hypothetical protein